MEIYVLYHVNNFGTVLKAFGNQFVNHFFMFSQLVQIFCDIPKSLTFPKCQQQRALYDLIIWSLCDFSETPKTRAFIVQLCTVDLIRDQILMLPPNPHVCVSFSPRLWHVDTSWQGQHVRTDVNYYFNRVILPSTAPACWHFSLSLFSIVGYI